jgi:cell fate regulator YaaT (PSP1 superfamily)
MKKIVGIRFKSAGKVYDFESGAFVLKRGDHVIVETEQGLGFGTVVSPPKPIEKQTGGRPLKKIFRLATENDFNQRQKNLSDEKSAHTFCLDCIRKLSLKMNLFSVEKSFDGNKYTFFFTAEGRVDFRNQAKMCGGIGRCGRQLCCSTFLDKFDPVSIRMAKEQNLSLNPTKISGQCGRLMCCLTYEFETYKKLKKNLPRLGKIVITPSGKGKVIRHNAICNRIAVRLEDDLEVEFKVDQVNLQKE